jgi:hypothetical protein
VVDKLLISDAAEACGVSRREIECQRRKGAFPNAVFEHAWMIPLDDLRAAGYQPDKD